MPRAPRCVPLAEAGYGKTPELYSCAECGAVVASVAIHDKWHQDLPRHPKSRS